MQTLPHLAVIGLGNMGEAIVKGLLDRGATTPDRLVGAEVLASRATEAAGRLGIAVRTDAAEACHGAGAVVLAVKPKDVEGVLARVGPAAPGALVVSICAGVSLSRLEAQLPPRTPVVRCMPNTPAVVGLGASVYCANAHVTAENRRVVDTLLRALGEGYAVETEALLDTVTGLSGSGPAYVFAFLEALADGGVLMGLPRSLARALAAQTVLGAARLAQVSGEHTAELRDRVTTPGGTTAAALRELELRGFRSAVIEAVCAATLRSRELGG